MDALQRLAAHGNVKLIYACGQINLNFVAAVFDTFINPKIKKS